MQVSGLKSITAKHLAISCQCLGAFIAFHPALVALFTQGVAPPRLGMLMADFGRALQVRSTTEGQSNGVFLLSGSLFLFCQSSPCLLSITTALVAGLPHPP